MDNPIIIINLHINDSIKSYVFAGTNIPNNITKIFNKIEKNTHLTLVEKTTLKNTYPDHHNNILSIKNPIKFIPVFIYLDDNLNTIRRKIFVYISDLKTKYYILEKNQEIWINKDNEQHLGYQYINPETNKVYPIKPSTDNKEIQVDDEFLKATKSDYQLVRTNPILFDVIDFAKPSQHILNVTNFADLEKKELTPKLIDGYVKKYYPDVILKSTPDKDAKLYKKTKKFIERDDKIIEFVDNVNVDPDQFSKSGIINIRLHVNSEEQTPFLNLLKIFNHLRKKLSYKIPFVKYKDPNWTKPYSALFKNIVTEQIVSQERVIQWLYVKKISKGEVVFKEVSKGITLRILAYEYEGKSYYATLNLFNTGRIDYVVNYQPKKETNIKDIIANIEAINEIITDIKKIDYRTDRDKELKGPDIKLEDGILVTGLNTNIISLSI